MSPTTVPITLLGALLAFSFFSTTVPHGVSAALENYPHLQCSACRAITAVIGEQMNETARLRSSFRKGSRLDENNKVQTVDYEQSELRAIEIMDETCKKLDKFQLREGNDGVRKITRKNDEGRHPRFYGRRDREQLDNIGSAVKEYCFAMLDEFDEEVVAAIRKQRQLTGLRRTLCTGTTKVCDTPAEKKAKEKEKDKWIKQIAKEAEKKKKEDDAKAKVEEAAKAAQEAADANVEQAEAAALAKEEEEPQQDEGAEEEKEPLAEAPLEEGSE